MASGFEELEVVAPLDILRRGGVEAVTASVEETLELTGRNGILLKADVYFTSVAADAFDLAVVPGGLGCVETLMGKLEVLAFLSRNADRPWGTASICAGPLVLQKAGLIQNTHLTSHPTVREKLMESTANYIEQPVVDDGTILTSRGAGTAVEFGFALLRKLEGDALMQAVQSQICWTGSRKTASNI